MTVTKIEQLNGGVNIEGVILNPNVGLYACRIVARSNNKKDIAVVGPACIIIDKNTNHF